MSTLTLMFGEKKTFLGAVWFVSGSRRRIIRTPLLSPLLERERKERTHRGMVGPLFQPGTRRG